MKNQVMAILLMAATLLPGAVLATVPDLIPVQGVLTDAAGAPIDDTVSLIFRMYDAEDATSHFWSEGQSVSVIDGFFTAYLGSETELAADFPSYSEVWLGITVESDLEMNRFQLSAVPYALEAQRCEQVGGLTEAAINSSFSAADHDHDTDYAAEAHDHDTDYAAEAHDHDTDYAAKAHDHDTDYVNVAGDTMSGTLSLGSNDLTGVSSLTASNLTVTGSYSGPLPPPAYDSGWIAGPSADTTTDLVHNLGTQMFGNVQVIGSNSVAGNNPTWVVGVTSSGTGQFGWSVQAIDNNTVRVGTYMNGGMYVQASTNAWNGSATHMRVRLWR